jgi:ATP-dependent helicase HepA
LEAACAKYSASTLRTLIQETRAQRALMDEHLAQGEDRLLQWSSCRAEAAENMVLALRAIEAEKPFEEFALRLLDQCGVSIEDFEGRDYGIRPGPHMREALATLPLEGFCATFSRERALCREDYRFLGRDHPLIAEAMDAFLGGEKGNSTFMVWEGSGEDTMLLEALVVLECVADAELEVERYLPPRPVRLMVDAVLKDRCAEEFPSNTVWQSGDVFRLLDRGAVKKKLIPAMLERIKVLAMDRLVLCVSEARAQMDAVLLAEANRIEELCALHPKALGGQGHLFRARAQRMRDSLEGARFRVDALRLIWKRE